MASRGRRRTNGEDCHGTSETDSRTSADTGPPSGRIRAETYNNNNIYIYKEMLSSRMKSSIQ